MFVYRYVYFITIFNRIGRFVIIKSILIRKCNCKILNIETNGWILNEKVFFLARERFFLSSNIHIHAMSSFWVGYSENVIYAASHTRSSCLLACCGCCCCRLFLFIHSFVLLHVPVFVDILKNHSRENGRGIKRSEKAIEKRAIYSVQFIAIPFQRYHTGSLARSRLASQKISNWSLRFSLATIFVSLCYCRMKKKN